MANLTVTNVCNMRCAYCFAASHMSAARNGSSGAFISLEEFESRLDFLERSQIDEIRLIGGEPTLHPQFPELVRRARQRDKTIVIFTHGLIPEPALACLESLPPEACVVLVNTNASRYEGGLTVEESERRRSVLRRLGPRALLGFTIYRPDFQLEFLLSLIAEAGCRPSIRLGLAQPILDGENLFLHPKLYPVVGRKIARFAQLAAKDGVSLEFDCGFVRCMFSDEDLKSLRQAKADIGWRCNPILDIGINGQAIHCFPLTGQVQTPFNDTAEAATLRGQLADQTSCYRTAGIYRECSSCPLKSRGDCSGGCLAQSMRRFRRTPFRLVLPEASQQKETAI